MTGNEPLYFRTPMQAVEVLNRLLYAADWKTLARYYDLSATDVGREELESGRFFQHRDPPPGPPSIRARGIRHPFSPGFRYERHASDGEETVRVYLTMEIDQGGGMVQRSLDAFRLRRYDLGYQVLPDDVSYFDE